ncbi:phenylalanine--tRNA ligase subunit beta [Campylobacter sp. 19-13652]|uniref:phenylalanine--tRNA ligase subunit beta n=1 Tax=Campylobacter sp. 19-13652 TaxID=2840180 RepID=UPI001C791943|nr:phenylalanine--tRNA ligase subunit beta [Campylobacter sp. 19-13652]BCX78980.1 phenylalanine--tRNA ligase beta subunit [Campylobacter sp. 19-13652]
MITLKQWINEFIDILAFSADELVKKLNSIGLEVDSHTKLAMPKGVVVGFVKNVEKHPDADKLNVCEVDIGSEVLQIVCGAPNVAAGQYVPVATIGTLMPNGLEIKRAKLRGIESCGMICSAAELGLPKLNDGILPLDDSIGELVLGKSLCDFAALNDDVIEVDITPNRGDCQSLHGIARDLSAAFDVGLKEIQGLKEPENGLGIGRILSLKGAESSQASLSYRAFELPKPLSLPLLMRLRLALIGTEAKSAPEQLCEYFTYQTGVLLCAYDYSKLATSDEKASIELKLEANGATSILAHGVNLGTVGIYKTKECLADDNSNTIIIQASYQDPDLTSRIAQSSKQKTDELYRSSRGSEPELSLGLDMLLNFIHDRGAMVYAGAQQSIKVPDQKSVHVSLAEIEAIIGQEVSKNEVIRILKKLGFEIDFSTEAESMSVRVPNFRHDIVNIQDICEEVVRIIGIDQIKAKALLFLEASRINPAYTRYKNALNLRQKAASVGFFESVHYIFDSGKELAELGFELCEQKIANPINAELDELRTTLINHLLKSAERNLKNQRRCVKLFELGSVFSQKGEQREKIGFIASGQINEAGLVSGAKPAEFDLFGFANSLQTVIGEIELKPSKEYGFLSPYEQAYIHQNGECVGYLGRINMAVETKRDLERTYVAEIDFDALKFDKKLAKPYSKFPSISRDLSLVIPKNLEFSRVTECIKSLKIPDLKEFNIVDIYSDEKLGDNNSVSVKFTFQNNERTLLDEEVAELMDKILSSLNSELGIGIR